MLILVDIDTFALQLLSRAWLLQNISRTRYKCLLSLNLNSLTFDESLEYLYLPALPPTLLQSISTSRTILHN